MSSFTRLLKISAPAQGPRRGRGAEGASVAWLCERGVAESRARDFLRRSGCVTVADVALYLRLQLPPLQFANGDGINDEMRVQLGVAGRAAQRIISDLNIAGLLNPGSTCDAPADPSPVGSGPLTDDPIPSEGGQFPGPLRPRRFTAGHLRVPSPTQTPDSLNPEALLALPPLRSYPGPAPWPPQHDTHDADTSEPARPQNTPVDTSPTGHAYERPATDAGAASAPMHQHRAPPPGFLPQSPYSRAKAQLRRQLPAYQTAITMAVQWDRIVLWLLTLAAYFASFGVRFMYLVTGRIYTRQDVSVAYSWVILAAEIITGTIAMHDTHLFWKQTVTFTRVDRNSEEHRDKARATGGVRQTVHTLVTVLNEPEDMVRECVVRLLAAPEPAPMQQYIWVCDDGHDRSDGPRKRAVVADLRALGHTNVFYVGDRVKRRGELNGKSANMNHAIMNKIFPGVRSPADVSAQEVILVMDCDHMVKPDIFDKMAPCMLDESLAVLLAPQRFHNVIQPDFFDTANSDFMVGKMPYRFGAGMCYITGTNFMLRANAAFAVSGTASGNAEAGLEEGLHRFEMFSEHQISEDVELGARLHAAGYKSAFTDANVATGEVPVAPRTMWRQRLRWAKGHIFIIAPESVVWKRGTHVTAYQKSLYWTLFFSGALQVFINPIIMTMPFVCLVLRKCPYGMDPLLYYTHLAQFIGFMGITVYYRDWRLVRSAFATKGSQKVLWFTTVKAFWNVIMVSTGWKGPARFKVTPKGGQAAARARDPEAPPAMAHSLSTSAVSSSPSLNGAVKGPTGGANRVAADGRSNGGADADSEKPRGLKRAHAALSRVTEQRRRCMPWDGTLDMWALVAVMVMGLTAAAVGLKRLYERNALVEWNEERNGLVWVGIVFALVETTPSLMYFGYVMTYSWAPGVIKVWAPLVGTVMAALVAAMECRMLYGFTTGR